MLGLVLTYRVVFTPLEFLNYLQDCLERFPSATYAVLELSLLWVSVCHSDLLHDDLTRHSFEAWCEQHMGSEWAWLLQEIRLVVQLQDRATAARKPVDATATADKHYGPTPGILDQLEPDTVANQLTLFDEQLFTVLTVDDYLTASAFVPLDLIDLTFPPSRYSCTSAKNCHMAHGCHVSRKMATVRLADKHRKLFARLARLTDPSRNMANYRRQLEQFHNKPCIPFLPVHLKDLLFATETRRTLSRDSADLVTKILMSVQSQQAFPMRTDFGMQSYLRVSVPRAALPALPSKAELAPDTQAAQVRRQYLLAELTSPAKGGANKGATTERKPKRSSLTIVVAAAADAEADGGSTDGPLSARTNSVHAFMPPPRRFSKMSSTSLSALPEQARTPLRPKLSDASLEATPHRLSETWSLPRSSAVTSYSRRSSMLSASDCMDSSEDERHDDLSLVSTRSAPEPGTGHGLSSPDPADASLATRRQVANLEPLSTSLSLPRHFFDGAAPRTAPSPLGATMESASASINSWLAPSSAAYNMSSTTNERPFTASKLVLDFSMSSLAAEGTAEAREARQSEGSASSVVSSVFETEPLPSVSCPLEGPDWIEIDLDAEDTILESVEVLGGRVSLV
ncbi:uncharacterized protein MONBRDRAFT_9228 [Monosiga brevicollis MX1]|uniref:Ras-GEF domain-containing protein n=1 Tax=Monosiga brevicollis TaxID=81824 RepID=A9V2H3_MONBE|nr:uncharacterized protein MONBRDRAFT_9228 [Monosiga brevicollis MX1]EDQ88377.1 predicted protein [Monosiga brevicollis MX1]|eukprot:XP_001746970.1 hypothetical protein [Monosiga brevicollis MX1]